MMTDQEHAYAVKSSIKILNETIKAATAAGLVVKVEEARLRMEALGERPHQQFAVEVARPL